MNNAQPIFDPATHYRIVVRGRVDIEWLQGFDSSMEFNVEETSPMEELTMLNVHTDQSGIVGLLRRLHGLGITILQVKVILDGGKAIEVEEQSFSDDGLN